MDDEMKSLLKEFASHYVDEYRQFKCDEPFIVNAAKKEFPQAEYACAKLLLETEFFGSVLWNFNMRLENEKSITRYCYYQTIKQYFATHTAVVTSHFQDKYHDKAELVALEILMMTLMKRFHTPQLS